MHRNFREMSRNIKNKSSKQKKKVAKKDAYTAEEAILLYQMKIKERKLEDLIFELKLFEDEEKQYLERIEFLKHEQETLLKNLLVQNKLEKLKSQNEIKKFHTKGDALNQLKENIKVRDKLKIELEELEKKNKSKDKDIEEQEVILDKLIHYRDVDQYEMEVKIEQLEEEIEEEKSKQIFMLDQLKKEFELETATMERTTSENMKQFKINEADKVIRRLTQPEMRVISTNEWLKNEVSIHGRAVDGLEVEVCKMKDGVVSLIDEFKRNNGVVPAHLREMFDEFGLNFSENERHDADEVLFLLECDRTVK